MYAFFIPFVATLFSATMSIAGSAQLAVSSFTVEGSLKAELTGGGIVLCTIDTALSESAENQDQCQFSFPRDLREASLKGVLTFDDGQTIDIDQTWLVRDMASLTEALYDPNLSLVERYTAFYRTIGAALTNDDFEYGFRISKRDVDAAALYQKAQEKFGMPLPMAFREIAGHVLSDPWSDNQILGASNWKDFPKELDYWGHGKDDIEFYANTVVPYIEVGDGYGAVGWSPDGFGEVPEGA